MNITQARVRQVRTNGVQGAAFVADWMEAITGNQTASGAEAKG
jgi:thiamine monophosphate synthase